VIQRLKKISTQTYPGQPARSKAAEWVGIVGSSGGAKMVASLITYPHEVIRTRLRQAPNPGQAPRYTGLLQTLRLVIKEEG
jgi:solute carrier family 25 protein 33/36